MVIVYSYSSKLHTFRKAKWALVVYTFAGMLGGGVVFFGFMTMNQFVGQAFGSRPISAVKAENVVLREQLRQMSHLVNLLEMKAGQMNEQADELQNLLRGQKVLVDSVSGTAKAPRGARVQIMIAAATPRYP